MFTRASVDLVYWFGCFLFVAYQDNKTTQTLSPTTVFLFSTLVAIVAGFGALVRSEKDISMRDIISHALNMGTCGASLSMLLFYFITPKPGTDFLIIAIVGILGLMGLPLIGFATGIVKNLTVLILKTDAQEDPPKSP